MPREARVEFPGAVYHLFVVVKCRDKTGPLFLPGYDANFNLTSVNGWQYNYDAANHLTSVWGGGQSAYFTYDGLGRCLKRTINGQSVVYVYDDWKPIFEHESNSAWYAWNVYGAGPDEILWRYQSNVGHLRYHHDIHGNVTSVLDWWGNILEKYTYDDFGHAHVTGWWDKNERGGSWYGNRFMFQGRECFLHLAFYDFRNRIYFADLGRFLQMDPTGFDAGDMNLFRYCGDDPVDRSDPTGTDYEVSIDPRDSNHVIFKVPIVWRGNGTDSQKADFIHGLEKRWSNTFPDGRKYTTQVVGKNEAASDRTNYITIHQGKGDSKTKGRLGDWYVDGYWRREDTGAHEGGHLLGRPDGYQVIPGYPFASAQWNDEGPVPKKGYDRNNVMVNPSKSPNRGDFEAIEHGDGRGYIGDSPRTRAAAAWEASWGDGGWLAADRLPGGK